jgi:uncharacterized membrane protein
VACRWELAAGAGLAAAEVAAGVAVAVAKAGAVAERVETGNMTRAHPIIRFFKHLVSNVWQVHHHFSANALHNIEQAIKTSESKHQGEICFIVESGLHPMEILYNKTPKKRAIELFSHYKIWDTEHNNGVLIYLLLADRDVEIVADRGIHQHVGNPAWNHICHQMELQFRRGEFEAGVLQGVADISALLETYFPNQPIETNNKADKKSGKKITKKTNEIPNAPIIL